MEEKKYYLSSFRSLTIGIILILVGIGLSFIGFDIESSFWKNFQYMIIDFSSWGNFFFSLLLLIFKLGLVLIGYFFIKYKNGIIRAKIDQKGLYYKELGSGNKYDKITFDLNPFTFIPYSKIVNISYNESFWTGSILEIEINSEKKKLLTLNALSKRQKREIFETVKHHIK